MKTTAKQFNIFKAESRKWIDIFGLKGWRVDFFHRHLDDDRRGQIFVDIPGRCASIVLGMDWDENDKPLDSNVRRTAFHEVCELLLWRLADMAHTKIFTNRDSIREETHSIIRTLENVLFEEQ